MIFIQWLFILLCILFIFECFAEPVSRMVQETDDEIFIVIMAVAAAAILIISFITAAYCGHISRCVRRRLLKSRSATAMAHQCKLCYYARYQLVCVLIVHCMIDCLFERDVSTVTG